MKRGPGQKRAPDETNIFRELNDMQNQLLSDEEDKEEAKYQMPPNPTDLTKRR